MYIHYTYMHTYIHTYVHTYIHTYIHIYKHTYIHTYIHTHRVSHFSTFPLFPDKSEVSFLGLVALILAVYQFNISPVNRVKSISNLSEYAPILLQRKLFDHLMHSSLHIPTLYGAEWTWNFWVWAAGVRTCPKSTVCWENNKQGILLVKKENGSNTKILWKCQKI